MPEQSPSGRFVWYELMTTDPQAAQSFYTEVIGWTTAPFENSETPYTMWMNGDKPVGGVMELPKDAREQEAPRHVGAHAPQPDHPDLHRLVPSVSAPPAREGCTVSPGAGRVSGRAALAHGIV